MIVTLETPGRNGPPVEAPLGRRAPFRCPFAEYLDIPAVSISSLLELAESPKHYRYRLEHGRPDTKAMHLGRTAHTAVLEPMQFLREYVLMPAEFPDKQGEMKPASRRLHSCAAWCDEQEQAGRSIVTQEHYDTAEAIREAVYSHPVASRLIGFGGMSEASLVWTDLETGIGCKGRVDKLVPRSRRGSSFFWDLKTTRHVGTTAFGRDAARLMYHARLAWYADGIKLVTGERPEARIVAVQSEPPHDVAVYRVQDADLEAGRRLYRSLMARLAECLASGFWPGVAEQEEVGLVMPPWVAGGRQELETMEITMGGEPMVF